MIQLFSLGNIHIYLLGVTIAIGMMVAYFVALYEVKRRQLDEDIFSNLTLIIFISAILGARLFYVLAFNLDYYLASPMRIFQFNAGGLSVQGGLIFSTVFALIYMKYKKSSFLSYADTIAPAIPVGQFIGRIGCDVFGIPMSQSYIWGVYTNGILVHPVQIYESLLSLALFGFLWQRRRRVRYKGHLLFDYMIGYGTIRFFVEFYRVNPIVVGPLTIAHIISISMVLIGLLLKVLIKVNDDDNEIAKQSKKSIILQGALLFAIGAVGTYIFYAIR